MYATFHCLVFPCISIYSVPHQMFSSPSRLNDWATGLQTFWQMWTPNREPNLTYLWHGWSVAIWPHGKRTSHNSTQVAAMCCLSSAWQRLYRRSHNVKNSLTTIFWTQWYTVITHEKASRYPWLLGDIMVFVVVHGTMDMTEYEAVQEFIARACNTIQHNNVSDCCENDTVRYKHAVPKIWSNPFRILDGNI